MLNNIPENVLIAFGVIFAVVVVVTPIALRLAGLTGQQVVDVLTLTMQFFINIVHEFRSQNKSQ